MTEDVDASVAIAWQEFEEALSGALARLDDDFFVVEMLVGEEPAQGSAPYVQFGMTADGELRAEVTSNLYLAPAHALDAAATRLLLELGWESTEQNFLVVASRDRAEAVAGMAIGVLREVFGVTHPAFLTTQDEAVAQSLGLVAPADRSAGELPPVAVRTESPAHLRRLVEAALEPLGAAELDEDGDYVLEHRGARVWVCLETAPVVRVMGYPVREMADLDAAAVEAQILNRDAQLVAFTLQQDAMEARISLPCLVFVPETLRAMVQHLTEVMEQVGEDLALRTGGCGGGGSR